MLGDQAQGPRYSLPKRAAPDPYRTRKASIALAVRFAAQVVRHPLPGPALELPLPAPG